MLESHKVQKVRQIYREYLRELPVYKVEYLLTTYDLLVGLYEQVTRYGINLSDEVFKVFLEEISLRLSDDSGIEYDYTEKRWNALQNLKNFNLKL